MRKSYARVFPKYTVSSFFPASLPVTEAADIDTPRPPAINLRKGVPVNMIHTVIITSAVNAKPWYPGKNNTDIPANENHFYITNSRRVASATRYTVMVIGADGDITSPPAVLTFDQPGSITVQPGNKYFISWKTGNDYDS